MEKESPFSPPGAKRALLAALIGTLLSFVTTTTLVFIFLHFRSGGSGPHGMGDLLYPLAWMVFCPAGFLLGLVAGVVRHRKVATLFMALTALGPILVGATAALLLAKVAS